MALLSSKAREVMPAQLLPAQTPIADPHGTTLLHHTAGRRCRYPCYVEIGRTAADL